jgi:hypothetical protein
VKTVQIESEIGSDGVLSLNVPLGTSDANTKVRVTIEPLDRRAGRAAEDWPAFVDRTYGSCANLGLDEPDDLPPQPRDWPE